MKHLLVSFCFCFGLIDFVYAQQDTINAINEVNITDYRMQSIAKTGRLISLDTTYINRINAATLNDLLSQGSAVYLKDNGGGRLSTLSIRGTTASQNTLTWNGLILNTPTLGLSDLSLMPAFFTDKIAVQYGGNGPLNGSAAIGGAVHITSEPVWNKGWGGQLFLSKASFNDNQQGVSVRYSGKKYFMKTAFFHHQAENNYSFNDVYIAGSPEREQVHAAIKQTGFLQEHYVQLKKDLLSVQFMLLDAGREIPPLMGSANYYSTQYEKDRQLRLVTQWKHYEGNLQTMARIGYLDDVIDYSDSLIQLDDKSHGKSLQLEAEAKYIFNNHQLTGGMISNNSKAYVNSIMGGEVQGYPGYHSLQRVSAYLCYIYNFREKLLVTFSVRKEMEKEKDYPFLPSAGLKFQLYKDLYLLTNVSAVYRTPTLNDFYWRPGGNPELKPENGYQSDMRLTHHATIDNISIDADAGVFYMRINEWIQWVPDNNNNYSPVNIETVTIKGFELSGNINYHFKKWKTKSSGQMEYVDATNADGYGNASIAGKQLVYTPKIKWQFSQTVSYRNTTLMLRYDYTGYRYTTADNSSWLDPFGLTSFSLSQELYSRYGNIYISAAVNNAFDINYEAIALRPMPGRWYRISLMFDLQKTKPSAKPVSE